MSTCSLKVIYKGVIKRIQYLNDYKYQVELIRKIFKIGIDEDLQLLCSIDGKSVSVNSDQTFTDVVENCEKRKKSIKLLLVNKLDQRCSINSKSNSIYNSLLCYSQQSSSQSFINNDSTTTSLIEDTDLIKVFCDGCKTNKEVESIFYCSNTECREYVFCYFCGRNHFANNQNHLMIKTDHVHHRNPYDELLSK